MPAKVDQQKCNGCESCVQECPSEAISVENEKALVDTNTCIDRGVCVETCPEEAISMV